MSFLYIKYAPILILVIVVWVAVWTYDHRKFFRWLKDSFNLQSSLTNKLQKTLFVLAVAFVAAALLDLRGPEEHIDTPLSDQKTIVLIDTSASMLVEDVQPNRFKRAITVARHFVKNAVGHQISIVLFSDISKRLVPFTDDIDLLDARLAGLEDESLRGGSTNISSALAETVEALKRETSNGKPGGNILLITDAEENGDEFTLDAAPGISLAVVGIGTVSGGKIPMRTQREGRFTGYKTHMNKEVVSKLDEAYLDKLAGLFARGRKWVVLSFSMPTEEVLSFFRAGASNSEIIDQNKVRPVRSQWMVALGLIIYIISVIIGNFRSFTPLAITFLLIFPNYSKGQEKSDVPEIPIDSLIQNWGPEKKQELALDFAKAKEMDKASALYEESRSKMSPEAMANWGATLLAQQDKQGLEVLNEALRRNAGKNVELERAIHANVKKFFQQQNGDGGKNGEEKQEQGDDKKKSGSGSGDQKDSKDQQGQQGKGEQDKSDKDNQSQEQGEGEKEKEQNRPITNLAQREREIDRKRRMMKVPALLKQLMQDDRALQSEFIDTVTQDRDQSRAKKDW